MTTSEIELIRLNVKFLSDVIASQKFAAQSPQRETVVVVPVATIDLFTESLLESLETIEDSCD